MAASGRITIPRDCLGRAREPSGPHGKQPATQEKPAELALRPLPEGLTEAKFLRRIAHKTAHGVAGKASDFR